MNNEIQSILNEIGLKRAALSEFITALLSILQRKIDKTLPALLNNNLLFSHFMHQSLAFDLTLREEYLYVPFGFDQWDGLIQHVLKSTQTLQKWIDIEKDSIYPMRKLN